MNSIEHFDDLLRMAHAQPEPQRLLLVFTAASLPEKPTAAQQTQFAQAQGGTLEPLLCVDKKPEEITSFADLAAEAQTLTPPHQPWALVFVAAMGGMLNQEPSDAQVDDGLRRMVDAIRGGMVQSFVPFDRQGRPVQLQPG